MTDNKSIISHKFSEQFWVLWTMKKGILFLAFLITAFLFFSTTPSVPGSQVPKIQSKFVQSQDPIELVGMWPYGPCLTSAVDTTRNIALIGNGNTIQVLDISTPSSLTRIGEVNLGRSVQDIAISGNYAYVVTRSSLKMVDISDLSNPYQVWSVYFMPSYFLEFRFQTIVLSSGYAYVAATDAGLLIYDVSDPYNHTFQAWYDDKQSQIEDVAVWGNYAICGYSDWKAPYPKSEEVQVIDVSNPSAPSLAGTYQTEAGYTVQGVDVSSDGYACICQYNESINTSKIAIIDLATNPKFPAEVGSYIETGRTFNFIGNVITTFFKGVTISGNYAFFYDDDLCLVIINISTPSFPFFVGQCEIDFSIEDLDISGNFGGISRGRGFSLCDVSVPSNPSSLGYFDTPDEILSRPNNVVASGDYVYISYTGDGLRIIDVSNPSNPREAGICADIFVVGGLAVSGKFAFCIAGPGLCIVDISSPSNPNLAATFDLPSDQHDFIGIAVQGNYAYVSGTKRISSEEFATLVIVDISDPLNPSTVGTYVCPVQSRSFGGIALSGNYAYLVVGDYSIIESSRAGMRVINISNPANPTEISHYISDGGKWWHKDLVVRGNYAFLGGNWLTIIDISNPESPSEIYSQELNNYWPGYQVGLSGDYAYLGNLRIFDISDPKYSYEALRYYGEDTPGTAVSGNFVYVLGSLTILKNLLAPEVIIKTPKAWSFLYDSVSIEAQASHSSGIERVEIYVDDKLHATDYASTSIYIWDTNTVENGPHKIRARAYNNKKKSSDTELEVLVGNYDPPLTFSGQKVLNRSLSQSEYINVLTWQSNPNNVNIVKYKIYEIEGESQSRLVEIDADTFRYLHRRVEKDKKYTYAIVAVDGDNIEGEPALTTVH